LAKQFQRRGFLEIDQSELPVVAMFVNGSGRNEQTLYRTFLPSFASFSKAVSEEKIFKKSTNQKQELSVQNYTIESILDLFLR
jgi:hypothetical protein